MQEQVKFQEPKNKRNINIVLKLSIALAVLLVGVSIAYHFIIYIPKKDRDKEQINNTREYLNKLQYNDCVTLAGKEYGESWEGICKSSTKEKDCNLPILIANDLEEQLRKDKEECRKVYLE